MKRLNKLWLAASLGVLLLGCVPSVNPFFLPDQVISDARILGAWQPSEKDDASETWTFRQGETNAYELKIREKDGKEGIFLAHLFKIEKEQFLDLTPADCSFATNQADLVAMCMIKGHLLMHIGRLEPTLKLSLCDTEALEGILKAEPKALTYIKSDKEFVLTGSTAEIQGFMMKHLKELFDDKAELVRKAKDSPGTTR